jgi:hypothetical protein
MADLLGESGTVTGSTSESQAGPKRLGFSRGPSMYLEGFDVVMTPFVQSQIRVRIG